MKNYDKVVNLLGIARRAGKIISGEEIVLAGIKNGSVAFLFLASDAGLATAKKIQNKCQYYQIPSCTALSKAALSTAIGQQRTIVAVTDQGFARKINELIKE
ncbi:ribosomal protein L7Ae family protein [Fructilactobacillus florum 8D]|uniref:Ribosomal protein L7Ae family protein n=2 Tax=Fructilactobacillus florum TaxID=640331 RepID=W9EMN7_9LACO|nr:YlxQ-related RNA-binding protein [Fructilactobacillus florum]EKK20219.1 ribosomal protein L7Ae family protein [Fructilactobacillus florum 2F]ETO40904.1 ribosomal protein L7Ae family protein [Fructilactobacillus florum 8D]KRM91397.1 hypothetical protein FC87_GL000908 [Fructilactobacillus florum DSM 22689 = JCM 16035]